MSGERLVLIGYGGIARKHLEVFRALGAEVTAACNRSESGRHLARTEGGIPQVYADPLAMIEAERPDGIIACASVLNLFDVARTLIPFGIPVLLEKPPGTDPDETRALAELASAHDTNVMVGLNRRFYSIYHRGLERLGGREAVTGVSVEWSEDPGRILELGHPAEMLPLLVFANSLHGVDLLPFFAGPVTVERSWGRNLDSTGQTLRWQMALEGLGQFGAYARFASNWDVPGRWRLVVDAQDVRMVSAPLESCQLFQYGKPQEEISPSDEDVRFKPGFFGQAEYFLGIIRDGGPANWPACTLEEATQSMGLAHLLTTACTVNKA